MVVVKIHEILSFRQSMWLEKNDSFNAQKRNRGIKDFEKDFFNLLVNAACGKMVENVRNRIKIEFNKKYDFKKLIINNQN